MRLMNFPNFLIALFPNFLVVFFLALMLNFPYPAQLTEADFADLDSRYENCQILSDEKEEEMHGYLVQTQTGEVHLILSKQHSVFPSRWKIYKSKILSIPDITQDSAHERKPGMQTVTATLSQW